LSSSIGSVTDADFQITVTVRAELREVLQANQRDGYVFRDQG
jgi:hypothetical protein